ncbi:hypothetical protein FBF71_44035 [Bradyrhizobium elkanii]|nr:hypothetical protein [Bradyrhizobium elkanii]NWL75075.1 hypothetical protein [Bradyrhizobium elkanii]
MPRRSCVSFSSSSCAPSIKRSSPFQLSTRSQNRGPFHTPAFKAKVPLSAVKGDRTLAQLTEQFDVHARAGLCRSLAPLSCRH